MNNGSSDRVLAQTQSVCPRCLNRIPAMRVVSGSCVYLVKNCDRHGEFRTVIWRGSPEFEEWVSPKIPTQPKVCYTRVKEGCPFDCGLCAEHRQHTCTAVLEITARCNMQCPICFASSEPTADADPELSKIESWYQSVMVANGVCNIQLSGGEPTLRNDLPRIIEMGRKIGFPFIQLNTNGVRLATSTRYVASLKDAGLASVFLQFDGTEDEICECIRGRPLLKEKRAAIQHCADNGIGVVLVPTIVPGVNERNIGAMLRFALQMSPAVRGIHFQPISYFGRYPHEPENERRITLPEVMRALESQTEGLVKVSDFHPPGCENALCSFSGNFVLMPDGRLKSLSGDRRQACCCEPEKAEEGARKSIAFVARHWSMPEQPRKSCVCAAGKQNAQDELWNLDVFLERVKIHGFTISAMAFQDAWNLDLERLRDCCIHIIAPDGRLVPFCAYNLTNADGIALYRQNRSGPPAEGIKWISLQGSPAHYGSPNS